jgi:di/tricarboxylate transporter
MRGRFRAVTAGFACISPQPVGDRPVAPVGGRGHLCGSTTARDTTRAAAPVYHNPRGRAMPRDTLIVFILLGATITLFVSDRIRLDLVALLSLLSLTLSGILTPAESLAGFSDPVVLMITGLFVVGGGLFHTGVAARIGHLLGRVAGREPVRVTAVVMLSSALLSAVLSSTGTVAVMIPITVALAWNAGLSASRLLMPMAFGSLLGGMLTLIGTAPNLVVANQLEAAGYAPFGFFTFTPVGAVMVGGGVLFMTLFGTRLLPARAPVGKPVGADEVSAIPPDEMLDDYRVGTLSRMRVLPGSPLVDVSPAAADLRRHYGVAVLRILPRLRVPVGPGRREAPDTLMPGDLVDVQGEPEAIERVEAELGLESIDGAPVEADLHLAEALLTPRSRLIGQTLAGTRFRDRYGVHALSIRRGGQPIEGDVAKAELRFGDTLLVTGPRRKIELLRGEGGDLVVVARAADTAAAERLSTRAMIALAIMLGMMAVLTLDLLPAVTAVLLAAVLMVLSRSLDIEAAYRSINWESVVLIAGILPMATALEKTGGMRLVVGELGRLGGMGPLAVLAVVFLFTSAFSQVISNTATTVLVAPIALQTSLDLGFSPYPLMMTVAIAASTAFATPIASPVNTLVLGPGAYRFGDFFRVGALLQLVVLLLTLVLVPLLFPF